MNQDLQKIRLKLLGLSNGNDADTFALVFAEFDGSRKLSIVIGMPEACAIAVRLENQPTPRPLTHDMFFSLLRAYNIAVTEVQIYDIRNGIFCSRIITRQDNREVIIDSRTSDAVALALRYGAPIYTYEHVLQEAGINLSVKFVQPRQASIDDMSVAELERKLQESIRSEDYETAATLRDAMKRRGAGEG